MANGMGTHQSARMETDIWLTPPDIISQLGDFDLDPCTPIVRPWDTAKEHYNLTHDGLSQPWHGFVWMNPPYGKETHKWMNKLADHGNGIALIFARTETAMFVETVWNRASSVLFIHGRLYFHHENGERAKANSGAPSVLVGYGDEADRRLQDCGISGTYISIKPKSVNPIYIHKKSGRSYQLLSSNIINGTNTNDGQVMAMYAGGKRDGSGNGVFVREINEFNQKFEPISNSNT